MGTKFISCQEPARETPPVTRSAFEELARKGIRTSGTAPHAKASGPPGVSLDSPTIHSQAFVLSSSDAWCSSISKHYVDDDGNDGNDDDDVASPITDGCKILLAFQLLKSKAGFRRNQTQGEPQGRTKAAGNLTPGAPRLKEELEESGMNKDGILHDTEKTSAAEQYKREAAKREKDSLEQKVKELLQMLESQGIAFEIFRVKITGEMRERDNLLRRMNKRIEMLEILRKIKKEQEECYMKKEEQIKREASEREKDPSELKVQELQRKLENQKRVLERLRARMRKEIREREKTSAEEWARGEATERAKEPLEQKVKASQSKMEGDQSVFLKGVRLQTTQKMRERENLLRRINERFEMLEILGMIKDELGECCKKTDELLCDTAKILAECPEGEPSEREKELLEQKYKEISQKVEDQKKDFEEFAGKMIEEIGKRQKISAEERAKREAAEREKELLEQKVKELQEQLEDQERVSEEFRGKKTEKQRERETTSAAEMLVQWKIAKWQKKLLEQKVKELQQKLEDQERNFKRFRVILTKEMKEKDDLLRKMNERIQMLERLLRLPEKLEEQDMKKEEQIKREASEREKESLEKQVEELQQNLEDQERVFQRLRTELTEEMRESEKTSAEKQAKRKAAEREKKLLEQKLKELQQMFEHQERAFKAFRVQITEEVRERDSFLRKMNERIEMLAAAVNNDNDKDNEENTGKDCTS
nr:golgin subfamily A member 6-like protein 22 [Odocoileus virginianus texanus]